MIPDPVPQSIRADYEIHEWRHATPILSFDFAAEWNDTPEVLANFHLPKSDILMPGGGKSSIGKSLDAGFFERGGEKQRFRTSMEIDGAWIENPTHEIDCYKNRVALEVEWNNIDPFYDGDLDNFRVLFNLRMISVGIIITWSDELQLISDSLGKRQSYGPSTTHMSRLLPRIKGGGGGG